MEPEAGACGTDWLPHLDSELKGLLFWDRISLCIPGCPETSYADQGGLELTEIPASLCFLSAGINDNQAKER